MWGSPEANMHEALVLFMWENIDKFKEISQNFLKRNGIFLDDYIQYISIPGHHARHTLLYYCCILLQENKTWHKALKHFIKTSNIMK